MTSNNMYRVGDFVYFEVSASAPYQIRKIEELNKTSTGAVEAKVVCFYRRRDLAVNLIQLADKHQKDLSLSNDVCQRDLRHIRHRELFLSRQLETLPATHIRGKCTVTLHNDTEPCSIYLSKEDAFFFQFVYDAVQKTLQADQGTIREGPEYQADVPPFDSSKQITCYDNEVPREELRWQPNTDLSSTDIDAYLLLIRSLGTLGRAYYAASSLRQPTLSMSAAAAARDATHQLALDTLHSNDYNIVHALQQLCSGGQPLVRLDEMESWSVSEGNLFEEALEKYGKCFYDIQSDFLPWKHPKSLIEFYYMWKTTDHYIQQKRLKAAEAEHHLKQVYIPNYNKPNPTVLYPITTTTTTTTGDQLYTSCEACQATNSPQWYALGPTVSPLRVCADCWSYWKRYGDLKATSILDKVCDSTVTPEVKNKTDTPTKTVTPNNLLLPLNRYALSVSVTNDHGKLRDSISFQFLATPLLRIFRRLHLRADIAPRRQARQPFRTLASASTWLLEAQSQLSGLRPAVVRRFTQKLRDWCTSGQDSNRRRAHLGKLLMRLFPALDTAVCSRPGYTKSQSHRVGSSGVSKSPHSSSPCASAVPAMVNGPVAIDVAGNDRKRRACESDSETKDFSVNSCPSKKAHLSTDNTPLTSSVVDAARALVFVAGPKRRIGMGPSEGGAHTLMYLANDKTKRSRRKHQTVTELRRLGRRPCTVAIAIPNGPGNSPLSIEKNACVSKGSGAVVDASPTHSGSNVVVT